MKRTLVLAVLSAMMGYWGVFAQQSDCDTEEKSVIPCGKAVFYAEQKHMNFTKEHGYYWSRCDDQTNCSNKIMGFAHRCLKGKGETFLEKLMQGVTYEINHLCHPYADPKLAEDFRDMTECSNTIWPALNQCQNNYTRNLAAATKPDGIDIPRFCCAFTDMSDCFGKVSQVKECDDEHRKHYATLISKYGGQMFSFLCPGPSYRPNESPCKELPPADGQNVPATLYEAFVNIAKVLSKSPN